MFRTASHLLAAISPHRLRLLFFFFLFFFSNHFYTSDRRQSYIFIAVRGNRPGKPVQLQEHEIKYLCTKAREIFINQPILLELEAPIKICGTQDTHCYCLLDVISGCRVARSPQTPSLPSL